jgi:hypothetical protein
MVGAVSKRSKQKAVSSRQKKSKEGGDQRIMIWIGLAIGLIIGVVLAILFLGMCAVGK